MNTMEIIFFEFENDFVESLKCVPMIVRYKLDTCMIKLTLAEWAKIKSATKKVLAYLPCSSEEEIRQYGNFVSAVVSMITGSEPRLLNHVSDSWNDLTQVPDEVYDKAFEWSCPAPTLDQWAKLSTMQRFALVKLSRSGHEGKNFPVALREFGLHNPVDVAALYTGF